MNPFQPTPCPECGKEFVAELDRTGSGAWRHPAVAMASGRRCPLEGVRLEYSPSHQTEDVGNWNKSVAEIKAATKGE